MHTYTNRKKYYLCMCIICVWIWVYLVFSLLFVYQYSLTFSWYYWWWCFFHCIWLPWKMNYRWLLLVSVVNIFYVFLYYSPGQYLWLLIFGVFVTECMKERDEWYVGGVYYSSAKVKLVGSKIYVVASLNKNIRGTDYCTILNSPWGRHMLGKEVHKCIYV